MCDFIFFKVGLYIYYYIRLTLYMKLVCVQDCEKKYFVYIIYKSFKNNVKLVKSSFTLFLKLLYIVYTKCFLS